MRICRPHRNPCIAAALLAALFLAMPGVSSFAQVPLRAQRSVRPPELNVQFHRAETAWKSGNSLLEAKARIDRVIQALPDDVEARKLRAGILLSMGQPERALADARRATALGPEDGEAHLLLCEAAVRTEHDEQAVGSLHRAAELLLGRPDLHIRLSRCAVALGRLADAEAYARIALAGDERSAAAHLQLARVFVVSDQTEKAITVLDKGLTLKLLRPDQIRGDPELHVVANDPGLAAHMSGR